MIGVIEYGVANLGSILNMLRKIGVECCAISTPEDIHKADKLILPGVGAFDYGMSALQQRQMIEPLKHKVLEDKVPILGICLGMQMLCDGSEEGELPGLCMINAFSRRFNFTETNTEALKVPHMGWNTLTFNEEGAMFNELDDKSRFYFVHSYHVVCQSTDDILATAHYGGDFVAMFNRDNIYGAQFHPEKSHRFGMQLLKNFTDL
jgi:imidazole glycerol-phosphate synthase subunit HisH